MLSPAQGWAWPLVSFLRSRCVSASERSLQLSLCSPVGGDGISLLFPLFFALRYPLEGVVCEAAIEIGNFTGRQGFRVSVMVPLPTAIYRRAVVSGGRPFCELVGMTRPRGLIRDSVCHSAGSFRASDRGCLETPEMARLCPEEFGLAARFSACPGHARSGWLRRRLLFTWLRCDCGPRVQSRRRLARSARRPVCPHLWLRAEVIG